MSEEDLKKINKKITRTLIYISCLSILFLGLLFFRINLLNVDSSSSCGQDYVVDLDQNRGLQEDLNSILNYSGVRIGSEVIGLCKYIIQLNENPNSNFYSSKINIEYVSYVQRNGYYSGIRTTYSPENINNLISSIIANKKYNVSLVKNNNNSYTVQIKEVYY